MQDCPKLMPEELCNYGRRERVRETLRDNAVDWTVYVCLRVCTYSSHPLLKGALLEGLLLPPDAPVGPARF